MAPYEPDRRLFSQMCLRGQSGKYPTILNISRKGRMVLM